MCLCLCAQCRSPVWCVRRCSGRETLWGDTNALMLYRSRFCCVPVRAVRLISPPRLTCSITFERFISSCCRTAALSPAAAKPSPCVWVLHIADVFVRFWRVELLTAGLRVTVLSGKSRPSHGTSWPWNGQIQGERSSVHTYPNPAYALYDSRLMDWRSEYMELFSRSHVFLFFSIDTSAAARVGRSVWRGRTAVLWLKTWVSSSLYAWTSVTRWNVKPIWRVSSMSARSRTASILKWICEISSASNRLKENKVSTSTRLICLRRFSTHVDHLGFFMMIDFLFQLCTVWVQLFFLKQTRCVFFWFTCIWLNANKRFFVVSFLRVCYCLLGRRCWGLILKVDYL